jgi:hypothetical protein
MPYRYSVVSSIPRGIAVRRPTDDIARGTYYRWKDKAWTTPFKALDHVQGCFSDADQAAQQLLEIPDGVLSNGVIIQEYDTYKASVVPVLVSSWDWYVAPDAPPPAVSIYVNKGSITPTG